MQLNATNMPAHTKSVVPGILAPPPPRKSGVNLETKEDRATIM